MKHTQQVKSYSQSHEQLAEDIGDLYYDSLAGLLRLLSDKMKRDGDADAGRGRSKLASELYACSEQLAQAAKHADVAWDICEPYVKEWMEKTITQSIDAE